MVHLLRHVRTEPPRATFHSHTYSSVFRTQDCSWRTKGNLKVLNPASLLQQRSGGDRQQEGLRSTQAPWLYKEAQLIHTSSVTVYRHVFPAVCMERVCHVSDPSQSARLRPGWEGGDKITARLRPLLTGSGSGAGAQSPSVGDGESTSGPLMGDVETPTEDRKAPLQTSTCLKSSGRREELEQTLHTYIVREPRWGATSEPHQHVYPWEEQLCRGPLWV